MKICLVSTSDRTGGAAIATYRLFEALKKYGMEVQLLVQQRNVNHPDVHHLSVTPFQKTRHFLNFLFERFQVIVNLRSRKDWFTYSLASTGEDISAHPLIQNCDVIHLHWVNFGFLSLRDIQSLITINKPMIWTLHDMWLFTGGCHYNGNCDHYIEGCGNCPMLRFSGKNDLSFRHLQKKKKIFESSRVWFTTPSEWFTEMASNSSLLKNSKIFTIPNTLNSSVFKPGNKMTLRKKLNLSPDKKYILFGAPNIYDLRKGFLLLSDALKKLFHQHPEWKERTELLVFGKCRHHLRDLLPFPYRLFDYIKDEETLAALYSASDVTVVPSRQETFGQTASESIASGTLVVAFNTSGQAEIVQHKVNGYLAEPFDTDDLKNGIIWVFNTNNKNQLAEATVASFHKRFSPKLIAEKQVSVYQQLMKSPLFKKGAQ